jgi:hypothetical protein
VTYTGCKSADYIEMAQNIRTVQWRLVNTVLNEAGFEVLTAVSTMMAVFWVVAPYSLVEVYQRFRGPCCLHHHRPDELLPDYTAIQPRRQLSSRY